MVNATPSFPIPMKSFRSGGTTTQCARAERSEFFPSHLDSYRKRNVELVRESLQSVSGIPGGGENVLVRPHLIRFVSGCLFSKEQQFGHV